MESIDENQISDGFDSALIREAMSFERSVGLFAQFGGQGAAYFEELRDLYITQGHITRPLIETSAIILSDAVESPEARGKGLYREGFELMKWLQNVENTPHDDYLCTSPISYPLIMLTQLCQYLVTAKLLFRHDPIQNLKKLWKGATGHSQGVVSAVVISLSSDEDSFLFHASNMLKYMFWHGVRAQECFFQKQGQHLSLDIVRASEEEGYGKPAPLLAVLGLPIEILQKHVSRINETLQADVQIEISLLNGSRAFVCSGSPQNLRKLTISLRSVQAKFNEDQSRIPYSKRKTKFTMQFLAVSAPFHSSCFMKEATRLILEDVKRLKIEYTAKDLSLPVYSTFDGTDLRLSRNLMEDLIQMQSTCPVNWHRALKAASHPTITHIIDFGPGGLSGAGGLTARLKEGTGVQIVLAGSEKGDVRCQSRKDLFSSDPISVKHAPNWERDYAPKLLRLQCGKLVIDTKFSRTLGKPPIMVAGMTPSTVNAQIVAAFTNSGYHGELAGGGLSQPSQYAATIETLVDRLNPGEGIHINILYLNPKLWGFQFPAALKMRQEGIPIDSITVAAGVPTMEKADEILTNMKETGMKMVGFKPGSTDAIKQVVNIANNHPDMHVLLQWTGGRAGGHHSFEDSHQPILDAYPMIRRQHNIILVMGSGLGGVEDTLQYLKGTWSVTYGYPLMPFDAVLMGSRVMVALEALTSDAAKELIVQTPGVTQEQKWEDSYTGEAGGIMTVISELGEPIHVIATRGMKLWREFDNKFFSLPKAQQEKVILENKLYIIEKINADYQRPYFGKNANGTIVDLDEMTYAEVAERMIEMMFVHNQWIHTTYASRFHLFLQRIEERFHANQPFDYSFVGPRSISKESTDPNRFLNEFLDHYPIAREQLISIEDIDFFLMICKEHGKPVNFVPIIDGEFQFWFKKDSLWFSESLEFVPGEDVGRTCILQGPVAVQHSKKANEPIGELLGGIEHGIITALQSEYNDTTNPVPLVDYLGGPPINAASDKDLPDTVKVIRRVVQPQEGSQKVYIHLPAKESELPKDQLWVDFLANIHCGIPEKLKRKNWWTCLLTSHELVHGKQKVANYIPAILRPRSSQTYVVEFTEDSNVSRVRVFDGNGDQPSLEFYQDTRDSSKITFSLIHTLASPKERIPLTLKYTYYPRRGAAPLSLSLDNNHIKEFYSQLWFGRELDFSNLSHSQTFTSRCKITREKIERFAKATGISFPQMDSKKGLQVPLDFAVVASWESLMKALFTQEVDVNLLKLLHLSYSYKVLKCVPVYEEETLESSVKVVEHVNVRNPNGKRIGVKGKLYKDGVAITEVASQFFIPGTYNDYHHTFQRSTLLRQVVIHDKKAQAILESKPWFRLNKDNVLAVGDTLVFKVCSTFYPRDEKVFSKVQTHGTISRRLRGTLLEKIANITHDGVNLFQDPVQAYLQRHGIPCDKVQIFEDGGYPVLKVPDERASPEENQSYAVASGDFNPIHTNVYIVDFVGLPAQITHGMWTACYARNVLDKYVSKHESFAKVRNFSANFVDKVKPQEYLSSNIAHVGMKNGLKLVEVEVTNEDNILVLKGTAEVEQQHTAFVFTGQGSAEPGMGMDLYKASPHAKEVWDRAEAALMERFGFSILEIVNKNPKELTVHFGGPRGYQIREKYMSLRHHITSVDKDGRQTTRAVPLFPDITNTMESYTFHHPEGLLFATQFTQPALTLMEKATFTDMERKGLVPDNTMFAGHSLGEYAALSSVGNLFPEEVLVELVFLRGITMQNAVQRDEKGRSAFGMIAVNPARIGSGFTSSELHQLVEQITMQTGKLVQVVNYNVENWQYIITGYNSSLETLRVATEILRTSPEKKKHMASLVKHILQKSPFSDDVMLERGNATIPLPGIDVPFHSSLLLNEVPNFREYLLNSLDSKFIDVKVLESRYVPNLTAKPFACTLEYAQCVLEATGGASTLKGLLESRNFDLKDPKDRQDLAYHICVELLAYQFASPVRWIETQDQFFQNGVDRLIEIGPSSTLQGMAKRTLAGEKYLIFPAKEILSFKQDKDKIYFENDSTPPVDNTPAPTPGMAKRPANQVEPVAKKKEETNGGNLQTPSPEPVRQAVQPSPPPAQSPASSVPDEPVTSFEVLQVLLALKLKKGLADIKKEHTIKDLVGGKSAVQNEILGDLQKEFASEPEGAAETPLDQLAKLLGSNYTKLGPQATKQVSRVVSSKMPGGFGMAEIKSYLMKERLLGEARIEGILLHGLTLEPESRLETTQAANQWLDTVVNSYGSMKGITIGSRSQGSTGGAVTNAIDSEELYAYQRKQEKLIRIQMQTYASFLDEDLRSGGKQAETESTLRQSVEKELSSLENELGKAFTEGIQPIFDSLKMRRFNSFWNWARQEAIQLLHETLPKNRTTFDSRYQQKVMNLVNRGTPELVELVNYLAQLALKEGKDTIGEHAMNLASSISAHLEKEPVLKILDSDHNGPRVDILREGRVVYKETPRPNIKCFEDFVKEMRQGFVVEQPVGGMQKKTWKGLKTVKKSRSQKKRIPHLFLCANKPSGTTVYDPLLTRMFYKSMTQLTTDGISYQGKTALVTGCGKGSIGLEIVKGLLAGGARVIVTTSRFSKEAADMYRYIYREHGGRDSELILFPFNQGSSSDVKALVSYIYAADGLNLDLDFILPFAAIPEGGRDITNIDSVSELAHRIMLTNLLRMVGYVKATKEELGKDTNPTYVVLPLSPNHGTFGYDGLYSESKIGLETLFNKWQSEGWHNYISVAGAVIGWTRGTGLMEANNLVAAGIEQLGCRTFNQSEIAYACLALLAPEIMAASQNTPLWADFTGGMGYIRNLKSTVDALRSRIMERADLSKAVHVDTLFDQSLSEESHKQSEHKPQAVAPRANFTFSFPTLPSRERLDTLSYMQGMIDLEKTVVVVGMGEVGPWGNSRTRWEMESHGEFSVEGCIELAWIMGLIRYENGRLKDGQRYIGWVDGKSGTPVKDSEVKKLFEDTILKHCGIREVEPELFDGYSPHHKRFIHEVAVNEDLGLVEVISKEEADQFKLEHGEKCDIYEKNGRWFVQLKKGATLFIPRALKFDRFVAGQIPTGWNPALYGIPKDIIDQVDQVTLFNLVSTAEALFSAGLTDPYELYEYVHVSEVGNTTGSGIGGMKSIRSTYKDRFMEQPVQADILQELFINVMPAWVNMLLLSSSGPIKTPVGACATAAESIEMGLETILSGKAKIVIVGGFDDYHEESAFEFAQMKATSNSELETKMGRTPREMSRPATSTRGGFMESQGAGNEILMSADLAITMGLPIYAIVALTNTATDKEGRSVPAPGKGILTTAREVHTSHPSPLLDIHYRRRQLDLERERIEQWKQQELLAFEEHSEFIEKESQRKEKAAQALYGNSFFWGDPTISPLRGALAVWGLTPDDISVASFHGTGTKANDFNESEVTQLQLTHLGRTKGNVMPVITQKYLTGHPKGAAAAWMANGIIQALLTGSVPGNANGDNIDPKLRKFEYLLYNDSTIQMATSLPAGIIKSFGFGQASGEIIFVHPDYVLGVLEPEEYETYVHRRTVRERKAYKYGHSVLTGKKTLIEVKTAPPYSAEDEVDVYLDPTARAKFNPKENTWKFPQRTTHKPLRPVSPTEQETQLRMATENERLKKSKLAHFKPRSAATSVEVTMRQAAQGLRQPIEQGIGIDVQIISSIATDDLDFLKRNFTDAEIAHCKTENPEQSKSRFAGRWAAKEAVIKAMSSSIKESDGPLWKGSGAALKGIEILPTSLGPPKVVLYDHAANMAKALGIREIKVTISHSGEYAVAQAVVI